MTTDQAYAYMEAVDRASDRVITGSLGQRSWQSRELRYAIVGNPGRLEPAALRQIKAAAQTLRDPQTSAAEARSLARRYPEILWVASNVHGGEESGTEGSLRVLYELADRRDCAARRILDNAIVVLLPIQNPDGREADTRRNFYGFDLNRDWFARTQPETDAKLELLREYPGPLFIDAHEMGGTSFFFPPNADPVYHEITDESIDWINNVYGAAMADEFDRQGIDYFNRDVYDLFYMGYGDTVPATGFISAGMTYEKGGDSPISDRSYEQYLTQWVSLSQAATYKQEILTELGKCLAAGLFGGAARGAGAERARATRATSTPRSPTCACASTSSPSAAATSRMRSRRWSAGCSAWTSTSTGCERGCTCPTSRPTAARPATRGCRRAPGTCRWRRCRSTGCRRC